MKPAITAEELTALEKDADRLDKYGAFGTTMMVSKRAIRALVGAVRRAEAENAALTAAQARIAALEEALTAAGPWRYVRAAALTADAPALADANARIAGLVAAAESAARYLRRLPRDNLHTQEAWQFAAELERFTRILEKAEWQQQMVKNQST